jgi:hypothetical protein
MGIRSVPILFLSTVFCFNEREITTVEGEFDISTIKMVEMSISHVEYSLF